MRVVAPAVARPRAAVRHDDQRQVLRRRRPWAASGRRGSRGRPTTCSGSAVIGASASRGSFSRTLYCERQLLGLAVEEVASRRARRRCVAADEPAAARRAVRRPEVDRPCRAASSRSSSVVGLERLVAEVDARALVLVGRRDQLVGDVGEDRVAEVDALQRIGLDELFLARGRVEQHQARSGRRRPCWSSCRRACRPCGSGPGRRSRRRCTSRPS